MTTYTVSWSTKKRGEPWEHHTYEVNTPEEARATVFPDGAYCPQIEYGRAVTVYQPPRKRRNTNAWKPISRSGK